MIRIFNDNQDYRILHIYPQFWHIASVWVFVLDLVLLLVTSGIIKIKPQVTKASKI